MSTAPLAGPRHPKSSRWFLAPLLLLGGLLAIQVTMVSIAVNDRSFAVEPDYYNKAVAWDDHQAQERLNQELGWQISPSFESTGGGPRVTVKLAEANGAPISGARVDIEAFANARAGSVFRSMLSEEGSGTYSVLIPGARRGLWELRFEATRGSERSTYVARLELVAD